MWKVEAPGIGEAGALNGHLHPLGFREGISQTWPIQQQKWKVTKTFLSLTSYKKCHVGSTGLVSGWEKRHEEQAWDCSHYLPGLTLT